MDLRFLTDAMSVAPQINPEDMAELAALGFKSIISNRPDAEIPETHHAARMAEAAAKAGLEFRYLPYVPGPIDAELLQGFAAAQAEMPGPILAYCRSGTRCCNLWAVTQAGRIPTDDILLRGARAGYDLSGHIPYLRAADAAAKA